MRWVLFFIYTIGSSGFFACQSPSPEEQLEEKRYSGNPHPAAYSTDGFMVDKSNPLRKPNSDAPFYFKNCETASGFPSKAQFHCPYP
jgi:hypothetical protein